MTEQEYSAWLNIASYDVDTISLLKKENGNPSIIIYHMHQAIEKLLKALEVKRGKAIVKTHNLKMLFDSVRGDFAALESVKESIIDLHSYLPRIRYPLAENLTAEDLNDCYLWYTNIKKVLDQIIIKTEDH